MRNRRRRVSAGTSGGMGSQLLSLSLFVMLLAFFIILNAISNFEQTKVRPVMDSLGYTFASKVSNEPVDEQPSVTEDEDETSIHEGDTLERMQALFNAQIPGHDTVLSHQKGEMYVKLPFDEFEAAVMAVGQRNLLEQRNENVKLLKGFFLPTLVALMKSDGAGKPYRMDMMLNIGENPAALQNQQPKQLAATIAQMGAIAGKIEASGLSPKLISAGLQKGEEGTVELLFRRHVPFNPLGKPDGEQ